VIKAENFMTSRAHYAVDLSTYRLAEVDGRGEVDAVWFRRHRVNRTGPIRTMACAGLLTDYQSPLRRSAGEFLAAYINGSYGGKCRARWDGANLWCLSDEDERGHYMSILVPMLAAYPAVPADYDGWWVFER
jgi:hypothetical protein